MRRPISFFILTKEDGALVTPLAQWHSYLVPDRFVPDRLVLFEAAFFKEGEPHAEPHG